MKRRCDAKQCHWSASFVEFSQSWKEGSHGEWAEGEAEKAMLGVHNAF